MVKSVEAALGTLSVRSKSADLELTLSSSIKCTASEEDEAEELQRRLTAPELNNSLSNHFLYCGGSLILTISVQVRAALTAEQHNGVIESFSAQLRAAMLWHQLHFSPHSIRTSPTENDRTVVEVTLTHAAEASEGSHRIPHKLGVDVPFHDARPPPGVLTAMLESITLDMMIQLGLRHEDEGVTTYSPPDMQISHIPTNADVTNFPKSHFQGESYFDADLCEVYSAIEFPPLEEFDDEEIDSLDSEMLLEAENSDGQTTEHLLDALDAAIRRVISLSSGPLAKGICVESDEAFRSLSSIAPAVFRQGHLPAVASRAIFLPTISKSISAISSRQTRHNSTKRRASSILRPSASGSPSDVTNDINQNKTLPSIHERTSLLPQLLWLTLDRSLLGSKPERRLKPLSTGFGDSQSSNLDEELPSVPEALETCQLSTERFDSDDCFLDGSLEEDSYSELEDMLDDRGSFSDYGSDFDFDGGDGYDSAEDLQWDHDYLSSHCHQDNQDLADCYDGGSYIPGDVGFGKDSGPIYGSHGGMFWRDERTVPSSIGSPKSLAISEDDMLDI